MSSPSSGNVLLGRGSIFFSRFISNAFTNQFIHLGNCDNFSFAPSVEFAELANYMTSTTAPYKKVAKKTNLDVKVSGFEFASRVMALALFGETGTLTQSSGTATAEAVAASSVTGLKGSYVQLSKREVSAVVLKQGATTFTLGTDYEVTDSDSGLIRILPTGGITDGTALTADYSYAAITTALETVSIAKSTAVEGRLLFIPDPTTGPQVEITFYNVSLAPDGDIGLISDDYAKWGMSGSVQDDSAGTYGGSASYPYGKLLWVA